VLTSRPEVMTPAAESVDMLGLTAKVLSRAQKAGAVRRDARPEDIPMLLCALAGTFKNPFASADRYVGIMLDGLRAPGAEPTRLR